MNTVALSNSATLPALPVPEILRLPVPTPEVLARAEIDRLDNGVLALAADPASHGYRFTQDYVFSSPSIAAAVVPGRSANGRVEWKDGQGRTVKALQEMEAAA